MELFKKIFSKISDGLLYGVGFSLAFITIAYFSYQYLIEKEYATYPKEYKVKEFSKDAKLEIESYRELKSKDKLTVLGTIHNKGDKSWSFVTVEVELFDDKDNFLYECADTMIRHILPAEKANFKVDCKGCDDEPLPEYSSFTVKVVSAL